MLYRKVRAAPKIEYLELVKLKLCSQWTPAGLFRSHHLVMHYIGSSEDDASPIYARKSVQSLPVGML
jgi:hypothetical protein